MLILPLHRPLTRATFPLATMLLVLANVFVFFAMQGGDERAMRDATRHYVESGLAALEAPAFERYLERAGQHEPLRELRAVPEAGRDEYVARRTATDVRFMEALAQGDLFRTPEQFASWRSLRPAYDAWQAEVFTLGHLLRSSEIAPWRMMAAAFLHADAAHLFGNMVFLVALGLLVEGALGSGRFIGVYLVGIVGSSAASLLWRWGEAGGGLGASGAVAALMGAFCVVWGRQPVRFFYWFGVIFDYVRAPAIWLLPAWLGWEVFNLLANDAAGIGFDAHAGGIVSGAMSGAALVAMRQVREHYIRDECVAAAQDTRWERAQAHLGRMQLVQADALLAELVAGQPHRFDVRLARYRVACNGGQHAARRERGFELLALHDCDADAIRAQLCVLRELHEAGIEVPDRLRVDLATRWQAAGMLDAAETALRLDSFVEHPGEHAQLWFRLALIYGERRAGEARARALQMLVDRYPGRPQTEKARFLLENG